MNNKDTCIIFHYFKNYIFNKIHENCNITNTHIGQNGNRLTTIVASPSTCDPNYLYEWVRDSAIVINSILDSIMTETMNSITRDSLLTIILNYVNNHLVFQKYAVSKNKALCRNIPFPVTLGEPKFNIDLSIYNGEWGRPQNDGPALRAIGMIKLANYLLDTKQKYHIGLEFVQQKLYDSRWPNTDSLIKRDLEYIAYEWSKKCFDLWEEIEGYHFYTLMVQQKALELGSQLALRLGDGNASLFYNRTSIKIKKYIKDNFYKNGRIISSFGVTNNTFTDRYIDFSILLAFIHTDTPYDEELINTIADAVVSFRTIYKVNNSHNIKKTMNHKTVDMFVGRYSDDKYYGGNPWVLTTAALATMLLKLDYSKLDKTKLSTRVFEIFGISTSICKQIGIDIIKELITIERINSNTGLSFAEQIDRNTLLYKSADRLTWNYIEIYRALKYAPVFFE